MKCHILPFLKQGKTYYRLYSIHSDELSRIFWRAIFCWWNFEALDSWIPLNQTQEIYNYTFLQINFVTIKVGMTPFNHFSKSVLTFGSKYWCKCDHSSSQNASKKTQLNLSINAKIQIFKTKEISSTTQTPPFRSSETPFRSSEKIWINWQCHKNH